MIYYIISIGLLFLLFTIYFFKFLRLKSKLRHIYSYNRIGIFNYNSSCDAQIELEELERYKNNLSRVKIISVKYSSKDNSLIKYIKEDIYSKFNKDIVKTSDITWLERDEDLMEVRRKKLSRLVF